MKIDYSFTALTPLFTGSDENSGIVRTLRREKVLLKSPITFISRFDSDTGRRRALMDVVYSVYSNIPQKLKTDNYGFYDAYANKLKAAACSQTKNRFLNRLLESCDIETLVDGSAQLVRAALDKFTDVEFIESIKDEHSYLMILLREYVQYFRQATPSTEYDEFIGGLYPDNSEFNKVFQKSFDTVPYFGGNSIRGYLRRLLMADFCKLAGIEKLDKVMYHQLFTGGAITESTGTENLDEKVKYIAACPAIGLLGSAVGNGCIEGELKVIGARLRCKENGTGDCSFWELTELMFGTRLDSSKTETGIELISEKDKKKENPTQMFYQYETFVTGSVFDSSFVLTSDEPLVVSVFWRMLKLWKENNFIGGNSARDSGMIDLNINIPDDGDATYLQYIDDNRRNIQSYFRA